MNSTRGALHFEATMTNDEMKRKLAEIRQGLLDSGRTAEAEGAKIEGMFRRAAVAAGAFFTAQQAIGFVKQIAVVRGEFQQLEVAFKTMLGSKQKADALMAQMVDTAAKTPFDLQSVAGGAKQLLAYGSAAEDINKELVMLGNISAGLSIPLGDMVYLYGTTQTQGRLFTQDMRQFMGRGIPLAEELAKQFGVTKDQISEMVTAGKVGFPEVQKALQAMTSEGGKFHNLMEEQSKTITGQISNLGDAIDVMFNKIGKSQEGVISSVIGGASYLVEHYETILRILGTLITTYGLYKAALIAVSVTQKAIATSGNIGAWFELAKGIKTSKDAMTALNLAMGANPILKIVSLLIAAGTALYLFASNSDDASKSTDILNRSISEAGIEIAKTNQAIDNAFAGLLKAKEGTKEYGKAKDAIISKYGEYLRGLSLEVSSLSNVALAYASIKKAAEDSIKARFKASFISQANEEDAKKMSGAINAIMEGVKGSFSDDFLKKFPDQVRAINAEIIVALNDSQKTLREKQVEVGAILENYGITTKGAIGIMSTPKTFWWGGDNFIDMYEEGFRSMLDIENVANEAFQSLNAAQLDGGKELETVLERRVRLTQELAKESTKLKAMQADSSTSTQIEIDDQKKRVKALEDALEIDRKAAENTLSQALKNNEARVKAERELKERLVNIQFETEQAVIDTQNEGYDKQMAQTKLNYSKKLVAIELWEREERKTVEEAQKTAFVAKGGDEKKFQFNPADPTAAPALSAISNSASAQRDAALKESVNSQTELLKNLKEQWGSWGDQYQQIENKITETQINAAKTRKEINDRYAKGDINLGQASIALGAVDKGEQSQITDLNSQKTKLTASWSSMFRDLQGMSRGEVDKLIETINEELKNKKLSAADASALFEQLGKAKEYSIGLNPFAAWADSLADVKAATEAVEDARKKVEQVNLTGSEKEKTEAEKALQDAQKLLVDSKEQRAASASQSLSDISNIAGATSDLLKTFGVESPAVDGVVGALGSLASIDFTNPISIVTGGLQAIASLLGGIFGETDLKKEKEIKRIQGEVDALEKSYDKLGKAIDEAYSADAANLIEQSDELLRQQNEQIKKQIELEKSKKKPDTEAIDKYEAALEENNKKLEENKKNAVEAINGTSIKSAIDDFASAYVDAWAAGEDKAASMKEVVRKMIKSAVTELIKSRLSPEVNAFMNFLSNAMRDGVLTIAEQQTLDALESSIYNKLDGLDDSLDQYIEDKQGDREASKRGIATASQESVDENNGRLTAIQSHTYELNEQVKLLSPNIASIKDSINFIRDNAAQQLEALYGIRNNTAPIAEMKSEIGYMRTAIEVIRDKGIPIQK